MKIGDFIMKKTIILIVMIISFSSVITACTKDMTVPDKTNQPNTDNINKELDDNNQQDSKDTDDSKNDAKDDSSKVEADPKKIVIENEAFQIFQPTPGEKVKEIIVIKGLARVYEGTVLYELEDGHNILDKGFTTATEGAPGWGAFEIIIELDKEVANDSGSVILYEESAEDGSRINELIIPVKVIQ